MTKPESVIVASLLAIAVPAMLLMGGALSLAIVVLFLGLSEPSGTTAGLVIAVGLLGGIALDVRYLGRWVNSFYTVGMSHLIWLFVALSFVAIMLGMGVPVGNLALGTMAGLYVGRRHLHRGERPELLPQATRRVGRLTGAAVAAVSFPIGMLAIYAGEEASARMVVEAVGLQYSRRSGIGLVVALCGVLYGMQYWLARAAALLGYPGGRPRYLDVEEEVVDLRSRRRECSLAHHAARTPHT